VPAKTTKLAIQGGTPVRERMLPYGRQAIDDDDVRAVVEVLRSDWLTTGPKVAEFEEAFAAKVGAHHAVSFTSGTAALHAAAWAAGLKQGDQAITTPMTFCATANCVLYCGAQPVFADVEPDTLLIDPEEVARAITPRTRALLPVDYAGHPAALDALMELAQKHHLVVIEDSCHALGARYRGRPAGSIAHMSVFSFHPVKHITTGEGGMVTTSDAQLAARLRLFRNHGISSDHRQRERAGSWFYEMVDLGYNYRLTDIQCALGMSQLRKLDASIARRRGIAAAYDSAFRHLRAVRPLAVRDAVEHAYHLYVVQFETELLEASRAEIFAALRAEGIGVNVHYIPVHLHPYYRERLQTRPGLCPVVEAAYERIVSLPMFPAMTDRDVEDVIEAVGKVTSQYLA
jgi:perosamine synthetase